MICFLGCPGLFVPWRHSIPGVVGGRGEEGRGDVELDVDLG